MTFYFLGRLCIKNLVKYNFKAAINNKIESILIHHKVFKYFAYYSKIQL